MDEDERSPYLLINRHQEPDAGFEIFSVSRNETRRVGLNLPHNHTYFFSDGRWALMGRFGPQQARVMLVCLDEIHVKVIDVCAVTEAGNEVSPRRVCTGTFTGDPWFNEYQIFLLEPNQENDECTLWMSQLLDPLGGGEVIDEDNQMNFYESYGRDISWTHRQLQFDENFNFDSAFCLVYWNRSLYWIDRIGGVISYHISSRESRRYGLHYDYDFIDDQQGLGPRAYLATRDSGILYIFAITDPMVWAGELVNGDQGGFIRPFRHNVLIEGGTLFLNRGQGGIWLEDWPSLDYLEDSISEGPIPYDCRTFYFETDGWQLRKHCHLPNCKGLWFLSANEHLGRQRLHYNYVTTILDQEWVPALPAAAEEEEEEEEEDTVIDQGSIKIIIKRYACTETETNEEITQEAVAAFAVEGQVTEKSHWFQCLNGLSEKLEILKLEHSELLKKAKEYKNCLETDFLQLSTALTRTVDPCLKIENEHQDVKRKFLQETKARKDLYNSLIELKGNIRVFCRCRPMNAQEVEAGDTMVVDFESAKDGEIVVQDHVSSKRVFRFDSVFTPEESQEQVFEKTAPLAASVLDGYNVCIFAYGQTGTGKTFTMEGTQDERGVNYRTVEELFRIIREREGLFHYELTVSVLEVYNEQICDLLKSGIPPSGAASKRFEIKQQSGVHHVPGLVEAPVSNLGEAWGVLQAGSKVRVLGSTNANEHSSRSHRMHCVMVRGENLVSGERTMSKLWLIDLASSERVAKTDAQGEWLEAQNINKSLSALGDVISALATKSPHIPFRNSKLTHLLQDSLSGDSKSLMFVQISPNENDVGETLCSLYFASRIRGIELGPAKRQVNVSELSRYKFIV